MQISGVCCPTTNEDNVAEVHEEIGLEAIQDVGEEQDEPPSI